MRSARNYPLLLWGQFLSAFGDNALLAVILGPLLFQKQGGGITEDEFRSANAIYTALLFVPCVLLAPVAGFLNDRFPKTSCLVGGNALKLAGAAVCTVGAWVGGAGGQIAVGAGYFLVGAGTCFYGPAKYGALPEIVPPERLVRANGMVEMLTLLAVLGGYIGGSSLSDLHSDNANAVEPHLVVMVVFAVSLCLNAAMAPTPARPETRFSQSAGAFAAHLRDLLVCSPRLRMILIGTTAFWFAGAAMKSHFQPWGEIVLGLKNNTEISLLALVMSLGVMAGSLLAGCLHKVGDLRRAWLYAALLAAVFVPAWTVGMDGGWLLQPDFEFTAFGATLRLILPVAGLVALAGVAGGLFLIPLNAALQAESDPAKIGKTIAAQNLFDYVGMSLASAYLFVATAAGVSVPAVFLGLALALAMVATVLAKSKMGRRG